MRPGSVVLRLEVVPEPVYVAPLLSFKRQLFQHLFHLNIHNETDSKVEIKQIEISSWRAGRKLSRLVLSRILLSQRLRPAAWVVMHDRQTIATAHRYQGLLRKPKGDTVISPGEAVSLTYQLKILTPEQIPDRIRFVVFHDKGRQIGEVEVRTYKQQTKFRLPIQGKWWVMEGHRFDEHHGGAILNSQNFAYDLGVLGSNLSTYKGDPKINSAYYANGKPIVAAADGVVVEVYDEVKENVPVGKRPNWHMILRRPRDLAGNYVVLKHQEEEYTVYMHLKPGIPVKVGETLKAGQPLGRCGNSGNSLESHLHFQLQNGPDLFRSSGLPVLFSDFTIHLAHLSLYVPAERPMPLPSRLFIEPGRSRGAIEISRIATVGELFESLSRLPRCHMAFEQIH